MSNRDLLDAVRRRIGYNFWKHRGEDETNPQIEQKIDDALDAMSNSELLNEITWALEEEQAVPDETIPAFKTMTVSYTAVDPTGSGDNVLEAFSAVGALLLKFNIPEVDRARVARWAAEFFAARADKESHP